jgi:RND family efflux transporter MFP subunit
MTKLLNVALMIGTLSLPGGCAKVESREEAPVRPVKVAEAVAPEVEARLRYSVSVQPYEQLAVAFKAAGYVETVLSRRGSDGRMRTLQPGDRVERGTVLATVREVDYREQVNLAESSLREAEAGQAKAELDRERARKLFAAASLTKPDLDAAEASADASAARVASARAQVELARVSLGDTALISPIAGVVLERKIERGSLVGAGAVAFLIADISDVKATFGVPDSLVHRIAPGQSLTVTTEAFPGATFTGTVTAVAPSADAESRVFNVEVTIPNGSGRLRAGMIGTVDVPTDARDARVEQGIASVPLAAVVRSEAGGDQFAVFVVESHGEEQVVRSRRVTLGAAIGDGVTVTSGLRPGEQVVVMGATLVADGEPVRIIP